MSDRRGTRHPGILGYMFLIMFALKMAGPMATDSWWFVTWPLWPLLLLFTLDAWVADRRQASDGRPVVR